ncbi:hypothetical protein GJA_1792 [Janthinobacterium agaricidamnosum NBRC 102515 = DSM 9628]|uniref:Uncharacterized protein n=1 Tax=Janthinobacterium agaricidamnosum NBRC 102515 = DSM 9628 TaxID=1349767 RepID=W0V587_9BURK|nr:hypothetical protein GJA_1792 [Janthinobacterium agaricidamnosum NBRC 102515 = DSM 9628]
MAILFCSSMQVYAIQKESCTQFVHAISRDGWTAAQRR